MTDRMANANRRKAIVDERIRISHLHYAAFGTDTFLCPVCEWTYFGRDIAFHFCSGNNNDFRDFAAVGEITDRTNAIPVTILRNNY